MMMVMMKHLHFSVSGSDWSGLWNTSGTSNISKNIVSCMNSYYYFMNLINIQMGLVSKQITWSDISSWFYQLQCVDLKYDQSQGELFKRINYFILITFLLIRNHMHSPSLILINQLYCVPILITVIGPW